MLMKTPPIVFMLAMMVSPYAADAAIDADRAMISTAIPDIVLVDLDALTDQDKRRLDFYAGKIIENITDLSMTELTGERATIDRKTIAVRALAARFTVSSEKLGLTADEARQYFLAHFVRTYSGRLPDAMLSETGSFDLNALFLAAPAPAEREMPADGGYIDLLRDEDIGGVGVPE